KSLFSRFIMASEEEGVPTEKQQSPLSSSSSGPEDSQEAKVTPGLVSLSPQPGSLNQAVKDIEALVNKEEDGSIHGTWLMAERDGDGVRIYWDRLREPTFTSRWNPFANDFPFTTFTHHPVRNIDTLAALCDIQAFSEKLKAAAERAHVRKPIPGKANGVLVLQQPIHIEAYVGAMSFLGNQNKLGYCMARGNLGF
uniref:Tumor protein p63 regulated 1 n=1 Tax=Poecilia reticulata TaxID=8081 RepID=A0A3P9PS69_POERE